jgi:hypothetical protein
MIYKIVYLKEDINLRKKKNLFREKIRFTKAVFYSNAFSIK